MKTKKIDFDSVVNQGIKGKFVAREVKALFSYEMAAVLENSSRGLSDKESSYPLPSWEDVENMYEYKCPDCGEGFQNDGEDNTMEICQNCGKSLPDNLDQEPQEVFEWWIVTEWFYKKLKEKGHPVLEWGNNYYWGRCTTGQAILLDGVISEICAEMEILEGQKNDWSK